MRFLLLWLKEVLNLVCLGFESNELRAFSN